MKMVFNAEDGYAILGTYVGLDEGVVLYQATFNGAIRNAPEDCVVMREVPREEMIQQIARFARLAHETEPWVSGDSLTAMNSLLALGVEMIEYAQVMGAALTVDAAYAELRRKVGEGYGIGAKAHARAFEGTVASF